MSIRYTEEGLPLSHLMTILHRLRGPKLAGTDLSRFVRGRRNLGRTQRTNSCPEIIHCLIPFLDRLNVAVVIFFTPSSSARAVGLPAAIHREDGGLRLSFSPVSVSGSFFLRIFVFLSVQSFVLPQPPKLGSPCSVVLSSPHFTLDGGGSCHEAYITLDSPRDLDSSDKQNLYVSL